jgi:hypothetical protein
MSPARFVRLSPLIETAPHRCLLAEEKKTNAPRKKKEKGALTLGA